MKALKNTLFLAERKDWLCRCYDADTLALGTVASLAEVLAEPERFLATEYIFSTWSMPAVCSEDILRLFPRLKAVFYAAGSVQGFAAPFLQCGVKVFSAWAANAIPVAEFAASQIILANKGYFQLHRRCLENYAQAVEYAEGFPGNYRAEVGLLGAGMIGRLVIERLQSCELSILVYDPFLSEARAAELGVEKVPIEAVFSRSQTISNHLANNAETKGMLDYALFSRMKKNAAFINTGRGAQVVHADLLRAMQEEPERTALLDVTDPEEPLPQGHPLLACPNIFISPHRAGSYTAEIFRMGECMLAEYRALCEGRATRYEVTLEMLATMA